MSEHILFLTGKLAEKNLRHVLKSIQPAEFKATIIQIGINVAGLMTADMIQRRLDLPEGIDRVIVPGRCKGDLNKLSLHFDTPFDRGPDELKDLPQYFGQHGQEPDLSDYNIKIFAEIVDAPHLDIEQILQRAKDFRRWGANVIDIGCLPNTPFPHLTETIQTLRNENFSVSIDSVDTNELLIGGKAGADYLLSLHEETLWIADEVASIPVVIPSEPGDMGSLFRVMNSLDSKGHHYIADPVLNPMLFGFTQSLMCYSELRKCRPDTEILMGIGNVTELTDADTTGMNAMLIGITTELGINHVLTTQVSPHASRVISEVDTARRIMHYAHKNNSLPRNLGDQLISTHERRPFPYSPQEIIETASAVRDPSYRVQVSEEGIHVFNRDGLHVEIDPFSLFPKLEFKNDVGHAFYMGSELARAQIAWQLGKRYVQDQELTWGCAFEAPAVDTTVATEPGSTLRKTGTKS